MSCMDHSCRDCDHVWFDNCWRGSCPECGSQSVAHYFDEQYDDHDEEEDDCIYGDTD